MVVQVIVVQNRTVIDSDRHFNNLCGSHFQSLTELHHVSLWYRTLVMTDLIGHDGDVYWLSVSRPWRLFNVIGAFRSCFLPKLNSRLLLAKLSVIRLAHLPKYNVFAPKFCISIVFNFSLDACNTQEKWKTKVMTGYTAFIGSTDSIKNGYNRLRCKMMIF